jgi:hypothetical protein
MRVTVIATGLIVGYILTAGSSAFSQEPRLLLTPVQTRIYHACLTAAWLQDYCSSHAWGIFATYDRTRAECVAANHGDIFSLSGRRYFENNEGYCWDQAHRVGPIFK